ncbi:fumarylacetoacetate hydrolase family protein [Telmatospirillum sp.]|uniref:fumarylacetoacetate hydrolase family protein n=1 Tax=Telmatospirillum sp. TaxID=2079197 RepID=UPI002850798C|nr:fumarylacetoacetate hydrolase family protein [Telmatospirillum sp.]MDR3437790.1 fumarylacetoacetate hydrolase family protein [Telmatospirillum sp.]
MKLVSFATGKGKSYGLSTDHGIVDLGRRLKPRFPDIKALLAGDGLAEAQAFADAPSDYREQDLIFLPTVEQPNKIFCVGMNYAEKRQEFGETNAAPTLFIRFPDSQTGHACPVLKPRFTNEFDYEGELAVVIGKGGLGISADQALSHVAGYSCYMDGSVRDWQHSWYTAGKNWRQTGAFGPWLVTADEIPDPQALYLRTYLNGQLVQDDNTANMVHQIADLISYISTFSELSAGDVIITGSPGGVGKKRNPPLFLKEGDLVEVDIERVGRLKNVVMRDAAVA